MPKPYPSEFRDDVVRVVRNREPGVTIEQIAKDFGVHPMTLQKWLLGCDTSCRQSLPGRHDRDS
ncbi:transposase, partial [Agrococcus casei]|uniref:transposase n=1 Tax=Agrococcus casei TaxID=343512 RepID=UPI00190E84CC